MCQNITPAVACVVSGNNNSPASCRLNGINGLLEGFRIVRKSVALCTIVEYIDFEGFRYFKVFNRSTKVLIVIYFEGRRHLNAVDRSQEKIRQLGLLGSVDI